MFQKTDARNQTSEMGSAASFWGFPQRRSAEVLVLVSDIRLLPSGIAAACASLLPRYPEVRWQQSEWRTTAGLRPLRPCAGARSLVEFRYPIADIRLLAKG
jgi:hypothetical protein